MKVPVPMKAARSVDEENVAFVWLEFERSYGPLLPLDTDRATVKTLVLGSVPERVTASETEFVLLEPPLRFMSADSVMTTPVSVPSAELNLLNAPRLVLQSVAVGANEADWVMLAGTSRFSSVSTT